MYAGAIAGMYLFAIYGGALIISIILGWRDANRSEAWPSLLVVLFLGFGFGYYWYGKNQAQKREPIISKCDYKNGYFEMTDSTLRCERAKEPRFTVLKSKMTMDKNDTCVYCGKIVKEHVDSSCVKTDEELEAERWIDYLNDPL